MLHEVAGNFTYPDLSNTNSIFISKASQVLGPTKRTYEPLEMKALHSFETTGYVKLSAIQHNITRNENHKLQNSIIPLVFLGREMCREIFKL